MLTPYLTITNFPLSTQSAFCTIPLQEVIFTFAPFYFECIHPRAIKMFSSTLLSGSPEIIVSIT